MNGIFIKEFLDILEALSGCEMENKYDIYHVNSEGSDSAGTPIFTAYEHSSWLTRNCMQ